MIVENHLASPAVWVILPLQDWLAIDPSLRNERMEDERINDPANPDNYWRYRMHITIEEMLENEPFNQKMKTIILQKGR
jgi:4-alpha-glucanotransferase